MSLQLSKIKMRANGTVQGVEINVLCHVYFCLCVLCAVFEKSDVGFLTDKNRNESLDSF